MITFARQSVEKIFHKIVYKIIDESIAFDESSAFRNFFFSASAASSTGI